MIANCLHVFLIKLLSFGKYKTILLFMEAVYETPRTT